MAFKKWETTDKEYSICPECKGVGFITKTGPSNYSDDSTCKFCDGRRLLIKHTKKVTEYFPITKENNVH